jgi:hypothetical protein
LSFRVPPSPPLPNKNYNVSNLSNKEPQVREYLTVSEGTPQKMHSVQVSVILGCGAESVGDIKCIVEAGDGVTHCSELKTLAPWRHRAERRRRRRRKQVL